MKQKVIAVVGPTSSGKTALSVWLAKQIQKDFGGAEIISRQTRGRYTAGSNSGHRKSYQKRNGRYAPPPA